MVRIIEADKVKIDEEAYKRLLSNQTSLLEQFNEIEKEKNRLQEELQQYKERQSNDVNTEQLNVTQQILDKRTAYVKELEERLNEIINERDRHVKQIELMTIERNQKMQKIKELFRQNNLLTAELDKLKRQTDKLEESEYKHKYEQLRNTLERVLSE